MADRVKAPIHLWIVALLSLAWNSVGAVDYTMTKTHNAAYLAGFTAPQIAYLDGFPLWANTGWALGVWGAILGSILLLMRHRWAVPVFAISLAGLATSTAFQLWVAPPMPGSAADATGNGITVVIWAIAITLLAYALWARRRGWLG